MHIYSYPYDLVSVMVVLLGAVFVHACLQLSVSALTLLSSHTIARRLPHRRLLNLNFWYVLGVVTMITGLQLILIAAHRVMIAQIGDAATMVSLGILPIVALLTVLLYYRRGRGTQLWLPRPAADYITNRAKKTRSSVEAFALGMTTVVAEVPFAIAPMAIIALGMQSFASEKWLGFSMVYAVLVSLPLIFVSLYISSGHKLSIIQRWRENAKSFLQWSSAIALILLMIYIVTLRSGVSS